MLLYLRSFHRLPGLSLYAVLFFSSLNLPLPDVILHVYFLVFQLVFPSVEEDLQKPLVCSVYRYIPGASTELGTEQVSTAIC